MTEMELSTILLERKQVYSSSLERYVTVDFYLPKNISEPSQLSLLLINDGQDLEKMEFADTLNHLFASHLLPPLVCVGVHAGKDRKMEYGTAGIPDYMNRGAKADAYSAFITDQLIPYIHHNYCISTFRTSAFAGFSLGGLSAIDIVWRHPELFSVAGVFSGSLWWRTKDLDNGYVEERDRIMHHLVREGGHQPGLRFYFTTGSLDETADRNGNGIIDSIDDTLGLIEELKKKGYKDEDLHYVNYEDGRHDVETWARAMPAFLQTHFH